MGLMIDYALENKDEIVKKLRELPSLEQDPAWKVLESPKHWGVEESSRSLHAGSFSSAGNSQSFSIISSSFSRA